MIIKHILILVEASIVHLIQLHVDRFRFLYLPLCKTIGNDMSAFSSSDNWQRKLCSETSLHHHNIITSTTTTQRVVTLCTDCHVVAGFGRLGRDGCPESQHGGEVHGQQSLQGHMIHSFSPSQIFIQVLTVCACQNTLQFVCVRTHVTMTYVKSRQ